MPADLPTTKPRVWSGLPGRLLAAFACTASIAATLANPALVHATQWQLGLETGGLWQTKNNVRIPNDSGTRFALDDISGDGPFAYLRINGSATFAEKHNIRVVYAPLRVEETGTLTRAVEFAGDTLSPGDVDATYQFNSHRITYRYRFLQNARWRLMAGITALVRDAEIRLQQNGVSANDTNVGVVPLAHFAGHYQWSPSWKIRFDLDAAAASQGRAIDTGVFLQRQINPQWALFAGARLLEGGVDNDEVYNFAAFNYAVVGTRFYF